MKKSKKSMTRGSGNIFEDLGLPDADEHLLKAKIVVVLAKEIDRLDLTQEQAAERMGISQPDVSKILRGHFHGFGLGRLIFLVQRLGRDVNITLPRPDHQKGERHKGRVVVHAY
jgi:predicted XRE-type DNA-binding protein